MDTNEQKIQCRNTRPSRNQKTSLEQQRKKEDLILGSIGLLIITFVFITITNAGKLENRLERLVTLSMKIELSKLDMIFLIDQYAGDETQNTIKLEKENINQTKKKAETITNKGIWLATSMITDTFFFAKYNPENQTSTIMIKNRTYTIKYTNNPLEPTKMIECNTTTKDCKNITMTELYKYIHQVAQKQKENISKTYK